jgi:hypothetical protein
LIIGRLNWFFPFLSKGLNFALSAFNHEGFLEFVQLVEFKLTWQIINLLGLARPGQGSTLVAAAAAPGHGQEALGTKKKGGSGPGGTRLFLWPHCHLVMVWRRHRQRVALARPAQARQINELIN